MDITAILSPIATIGGMGLLFGLGLGVAAKKFAVPVDDRVEAIKECLPGANCGGCGLAGCEAMAKSIVAGESAINACPVCNEDQVSAIAKIMGEEADASEKKVAVIRCKGNLDKAGKKFEYQGLMTCQDAALIGGGPKLCSYGCLGYGTCEATCQFGAIHMKDGLPVIDRELCVGCGACERQCPRNVIHLVPISSSYHVDCVSKDKGKDVKAACQVGCLGCGLCAKQCEAGAISLKDNYAVIEPSLCISCGKCSSKCPTKAISNLLDQVLEKSDKDNMPIQLANKETHVSLD